MSVMAQNDVRYAPRQAEIVSDLLERIQSNQFPPGAELPSIVELSKRYRASTGTVQRAIVQLRERGYVHTTSRGSLVAEDPPHLSNFGMVLPYYDYQSQYIVALKREVQRLSGTRSAEGIERRFSFFSDIVHPEEQVRQHSKLILAMQERSVGGLILVTGHTVLRDIMQSKAEVPCVTMFTSPTGGIPNITHTLILQRALDILKAKGRRSVALLTGARECKAITAAFVAMASERDIATHPRWIHGIAPQSMSWAETCTELLMNDRQPPDALIIGDDNFVPYATAGIAASGVKVPDDLMIVAHANFPYPTRCEVPAIRIGTDVRRLLKTAVETIEAKRRGEDVPNEILMQPCLESEASN